MIMRCTLSHSRQLLTCGRDAPLFRDPDPWQKKTDVLSTLWSVLNHSNSAKRRPIQTTDLPGTFRDFIKVAGSTRTHYRQVQAFAAFSTVRKVLPTPIFLLAFCLDREMEDPFPPCSHCFLSSRSRGLV